MSIVKLLEKVGDDNIEFQNLRQSLTGVKVVKGANEVSFVTDNLTPDDIMHETGKVGLVIWVDEDVISKAMATLTTNNKG